MAKTGEALVDEVQELVGRSGDTVLVTDARCTRWLNEAQREIVENVPAMPSQTFMNRSSLDTTATLRYAINDITVGDLSADRICRIWNVWYIDGLESKELDYKQVDEFDAAWPDPTDSNVPNGRPNVWTRRGQNIEVMPICGTADYDNDLRFDGDWYAGEFTTNDATISDLSNCDEGMILFAVAKAWGAIGDEVKATIWNQKYEKWLRQKQTFSNTDHAWGGGLFE